MKQAQLERPRLRKSILWLLIVTVVLAVCFPLLVRSLLLRTEYAAGFTKAQFQQVQPGDTLAAVYDRLKAPLNVVVISQRQDDSRFKPEYVEDLSVLWRWSNDPAVWLILRYSKPRMSGGSYRAYEVWITNGKVQETRAYSYWD